MRTIRNGEHRSTIGGVLALGLGLTACSGPAPVESTMARPAMAVGIAAPLSATVPVNVANATSPAQADWLDFAWQSFVAVNWPAATPASGVTLGQPDTSKTIGATGANGATIPTVWLTYRDIGSTMLVKGADPGPWNAPLTQPASQCAAAPADGVAPGFQPIVLDMISKFGKFPSEISEASGGPLIDQQGWYVIYDVRLSQSEYTYIQQNAYYDAANQIKAFAPQGPGFQPFPKSGQEASFKPPLPAHAQFGALEVKAAWRVLDPQKDVFSRYYTQTGYFMQPDGMTCQGPVTFGLIGLHILRLTPTTGATWFWSTFEHVDNVAVPDGVKRPDGTALTPSLAQAGTPNGNCGTGKYNLPPPAISGNIRWASTNTPVNVCQESYPLDTAVQQVNQAWQAQLQGTPFAYYQLIGTTNPTVPGQTGFVFPPINYPSNTVNVNSLANTSMETYFQDPGKNCLSCHGYGAPQGAPKTLTAANQIFTFVLSNADSSSTDPSLRARPVLPPATLRRATPR